MELVVSPSGTIRCLYDEALDLRVFGSPVIQRASHVEPNEYGLWWANLAPVGGPLLGPFGLRSQALEAEKTWLKQNLFS